MRKEDLEQLVKDLMEMNKYLVKENEELKNELKKSREIFLETIDKWNESVNRLAKKRVLNDTLLHMTYFTLNNKIPSLRNSFKISSSLSKHETQESFFSN